MRPRTVVVLGGLFVLFGGLVVFGLGVADGGTLGESWISETPRDNQVNHHAVGVGPNGDVLVAPVAAVPNSDVNLTETSCALVRLGPENGTVHWRIGTPPAHCFTHALTQPAIADVGGDGRLEVAVSTTENALVLYDAQSTDEIWRVPLRTYGYGQPTIANLTSAPGLEIVTSDISGGVVAARANGSVAWRVSLNDTFTDRTSVWDEPHVEDLDGDGSPEVVIASNRGLAVLTHAGDLLWKRNGSVKYATATRLEGDTAATVFGAGTADIRAFDGKTGELNWRRDLTNVRFGTARDADDDGTVELYAGRVGGTVLALDATTGETEWSTSVAQSEATIVPAPVLGDVDGDGNQEVVSVLDTGSVVVLDPESGSELARYERSVPIWTVPTLSDIDDDSQMEILVRYGDGRVVALSYSG